MLIAGSSYSISFGMKYGGLWHEFCEAASTGNVNKIKICLEKLKDPDLKSFFVRAKDESGYTALHYALMHKHPEVVIILLEYYKELPMQIPQDLVSYLKELGFLK